MGFPHTAGLDFRAGILQVSPQKVVLGVSGEVDISNQDEFEAALSSMMATRARSAVIEASDCSFISLQGFAAIGRCSLGLDRLTLRTRLLVARRVLDLLGFHNVVCLPAGPADRGLLFN